MTHAGRFAGWGIRGTLALALAVVGTSQAFAQTAQSFEELYTQQLLEIGDTATVVDATGKTFRGTVQSLDPSSLTLSTDSGARVFAEDDVRRIRRRGASAMPIAGLTGALAGFGFAAFGASAYGMNEGGGFCGGCLVQWSVVTVPMGAAAGALIGFAIDLSARRTVFASAGRRSSVLIAPIVSPRAVGATALVAF